MSQDAKPARPGQATFAGWLIVAGSVILVATAWQRVAGLHTLEAQDELRQMLAEPPLSDTGLSLGALSETMRILSMVAAGSATAAAILGFWAMRRSSGARLALSLLAPLILVGGLATAGFFAPLIVAGTVMLWLTPTRDWIAGRPWRQPGPPAAGPTRPDPFAPRPDAERPDPGRPDAGPPSGPRPSPTYPTPLPPASYAATPATRDGRPGAVAGACLLAWGLCALVAGVMTVCAVVAGSLADETYEQYRKEPPAFGYQAVTRDDFLAAVYVLVFLGLLWAIGTVVVAVLAFRGMEWARWLTIVSMAAAGLFGLVMAFANPLLLVVVAACGASVWLLLRPEVTAWYRSR